MIRLLLGLTIVVLVAIFIWGRGAHTIVRIEGGRATVTKGRLPPKLVGDLRDVARRTRARGTVNIDGRGDSLRVTSTGLGDRVEQQVRNVVLGYRDQIRPLL